LICLDIYDEENEIYTPYNFLDFCRFECRYNELTERYDVNGLSSSTLLIASFEDEELAVAVTRSLLTLKSMAEVNPQPEARFIDVDMIIEELENMEEEEEEVLITDEQVKERTIGNIIDQNYSYIVCILIGFMIGFIIVCVVN
jgi:hypothetical protein